MSKVHLTDKIRRAVVLEQLLAEVPDGQKESVTSYYRNWSLERLWEELFDQKRKAFNMQAAAAMFMADAKG